MQLGRILVVFLPGESSVYVDTGRREYSGTGRNRQVTKTVTEVDMMSAVPTSPLRNTSGSGLEISAAEEGMAALLRKTAHAWTYRCTIEEQPTLRPLAYVTGTKKLVAGMVRERTSGGLLILLPDFIVYDDIEEEEGGGEVERVDVPPEIHQHRSALLEWLVHLSGGEKAAAPEWVARYRFDSERLRQGELEKVEESLVVLMQEKDALKAALATDEQWKSLIHASGDALERQVQKAFELLGFAMEDKPRGRSDLRASYGERLAVVEIKGIAKSAAEKHAAQLEKWVSSEVAEGEVCQGHSRRQCLAGLAARRTSRADIPRPDAGVLRAPPALLGDGRSVAGNGPSLPCRSRASARHRATAPGDDWARPWLG